ncbi:unnamed protein product [Protopolystoma xenopodis]|uniref:Uncharacterized protein n=1 Tax=Protopolystoma xenopodis TaxID=117903 RepID=A0A448XB50_9PLAT|nr:unnamed protein product [Protopolystoma xenopodis]
MRLSVVQSLFGPVVQALSTCSRLELKTSAAPKAKNYIEKVAAPSASTIASTLASSVSSPECSRHCSQLARAQLTVRVSHCLLRTLYEFLHPSEDTNSFDAEAPETSWPLLSREALQLVDSLLQPPPQTTTVSNSSSSSLSHLEEMASYLILLARAQCTNNLIAQLMVASFSPDILFTSGPTSDSECILSACLSVEALDAGFTFGRLLAMAKSHLLETDNASQENTAGIYDTKMDSQPASDAPNASCLAKRLHHISLECTVAWESTIEHPVTLGQFPLIPALIALAITGSCTDNPCCSPSVQTDSIQASISSNELGLCLATRISALRLIGVGIHMDGFNETK